MNFYIQFNDRNYLLLTLYLIYIKIYNNTVQNLVLRDEDFYMYQNLSKNKENKFKIYILNCYVCLTQE